MIVKALCALCGLLVGYATWLAMGGRPFGLALVGAGVMFVLAFVWFVAVETRKVYRAGRAKERARGR